LLLNDNNNNPICNAPGAISFRDPEAQWKSSSWRCPEKR